MDTLVDSIRACTLCTADLPCKPKPVLQLHTDARILVAGQAPGKKAHDSGVPFDDASGERLRDWMGVDDVCFYDAQQIAILPMGFCYPGKGEHGDLPPVKRCAKTWRTEALAQLKQVQLTLVLGQYAMRYHLPDVRGTLTETVKQWQSTQPTLFALPHPSPRNRPWLARNPWFERELLPILRARVQEVLRQA